MEGYTVVDGPAERVRYEYGWARSLCAGFADRLVPGLLLRGDTSPAEVVDTVTALAALGASRVTFRCGDSSGLECLDVIARCRRPGRGEREV